MHSELSILLVGDIVEDSNATIKRPVFDEDNPSRSEVANLMAWITEAGYQVDVCNSVCSFIESGPANKDVLVFPLWRGGASRNRTAIVPAYCEARNIPYVGGDANIQTVCQDKSLSKMLVNAVGMRVPGEVVLYSEDDLTSFSPSSHLCEPFVIKPLYSACSIGVADSSLCHYDDEARDRAAGLFAAGLGPVVCEEFISGEDISLSFIEERGAIIKRCVGVYRGINGISPFLNRLFTFDDKMNMAPHWSISVLPDTIVQNAWTQTENLIRRLGKVDIMRIDGRLNEDGFVFIELTPDIHMAMESIFLGSFNAAGSPPAELLDYVIRTSIKNQRNSPTNIH
jgi:D-alanine-D-alanine ligase